MTIFALDEIKHKMRQKDLQVRKMYENEKYIEFNGRPPNLLGYQFCELQLGDSYVRKTRIRIATKWNKINRGRGCLSLWLYKFAPQTDEGELIVNSIEKVEISKEKKRHKKESQNCFRETG